MSYDYDLIFSNDGTNWDGTVEVRDQNESKTLVTTKLGEVKNYRYIRVTNKKARNASDWGIKIFEFRVYNIATYSIDHITVSPTFIRNGVATELAMTAYDQLGEVVDATFSVKSGSATFAADGKTLTGTADGTVTIAGTYGGVEKTQDVTIYTPTIDHITVTPENIRTGKPTELTMTAYDQHDVVISDGVTWEVSAKENCDATLTGNTLTATKSGVGDATVTIAGKYNGTLYNASGQTKTLTVYAQELSYITVSPQIVRAGVETPLTLKAYDQQNEEITEGITWSSSLGTLADKTLSLAKDQRGDVTISGNLEDGTPVTYTLYAVGDADKPRIPTDVYLPVFTVTEDGQLNEGTKWGWASEGTTVSGVKKLLNRPYVLISNDNMIAVSNTHKDLPFDKADNADLKFTPENCRTVKVDVFAPRAGINTRIYLEGYNVDAAYTTLTKGAWTTLELPVNDTSKSITTIKIQSEAVDGIYPDILVANVYFTKVMATDKGPEWQTDPAVVEGTLKQTSATIKMKATDDLSENIFFLVTDDADESFFRYVKGTKEVEQELTLTGLKPGKTYNLTVHAYDEGGNEDSYQEGGDTKHGKKIQIVTPSVTLKSIKVSPKTQYIKNGVTSEELTVTVIGTGDDGKDKEYTDEQVDITYSIPVGTTLVSYVSGSKGQYTAAASGTGLVTVTIRATSGNTVETTAAIHVYDSNTFSITYKVNDGTEQTLENITTGGLKDVATPKLSEVTYLKITTGFINNDDIKTIRQMAGAKNCLVNATADDVIDNGKQGADGNDWKTFTDAEIDEKFADEHGGTTNATVGVLTELDLSGAIFVADGEPYATFSNTVREPGVGTDTGERETVQCEIVGADVLPDHIFANCVNLTTVTLPNTAGGSIDIESTVGGAQFAGCTNLTTVNNFNKVVGVMPQYCFYRSGLTSYDLTATKFTEIGASAFRRCQSLEDVTFPSGETPNPALTWIHFNAFEGCPKINLLPKTDDTFTFPNTLTHIDNLAFKDCVEFLKDGDTYILDGDHNRVIKYDGATKGDNNMYTFTMETVEVNESYSFEREKITGAAGLSGKLVFPSSVEYIGQGAFENDAKLASIDLTACHSTLKTIENRAFINCTSMDLAGTDTPAPSYAQNRLPATAGLYIGDYTFKNTSITGLINIPAKLEDGKIRYNTFGDSQGITAINLPTGDKASGEGVYYIDDVAFSNTGLTEVTFPTSIDSIGTAAFNANPNLKTITFPAITDHVVKIKGAAFQWTGVENVSIGAGTQIILMNNAFQECDYLSSGVINTVLTYLTADKTIHGATFWGCKGASLTNVVIPENITTIEEAAFMNCRNMETITIGENVTYIGRMAFGIDDNDKGTVVPSKITQINVKGATAPTCYPIADTTNDAGETVHNDPFYKTEPNKCEVVFSTDDAKAYAADGATGYKTYRNQAAFMRLLTKTASISNTTYDIVPQMYGDFVISDRTFSKGWNILSLPFGSPAANAKDVNGTEKYANAFNKKGAIGEDDNFDHISTYRGLSKENVLVFRIMSNPEEMKDFEPIMVKLKKDVSNVTFSDVDINYGHNASSGVPETRKEPTTLATVWSQYEEDNGFAGFKNLDKTEYVITGTYKQIQNNSTSDMNIIKEGDYILQNTGGKATLVKCLSGRRYGIRAFSAYFKVKEVGGSAKAQSLEWIDMEDENVVNEIGTIDLKTGEMVSTPQNIYSLNGQLVRANATTTAGLAKGIYIMGGRKIVVR